MNYYVADLHLGHENIIKLSKRPFSSVKEMDEFIINSWNQVVTDNDDVYILGDISFKAQNVDKYLNRLKGKKHLIAGNHDSRILKDRSLRKYFVEITNMKTIIDGNYRIVLCHYPLVEWDGYYRETYHFYGHIHNNFHNATTQYISSIKNAFNVGVDVIGFRPKTAKEIITNIPS